MDFPITARTVNKHAVEENWEKATNFIPKEGEIIIYDADSNHSSPRLKVGNGDNSISDLPFLIAPEAETITWKKYRNSSSLV